MSDPRPPPQNTVQAVGTAATDVISGLKQSPILLAMVVLQVLTLTVALYVSLRRQEVTGEQFAAVYRLLERCFPQGRP